MSAVQAHRAGSGHFRTSLRRPVATAAAAAQAVDLDDDQPAVASVLPVAQAAAHVTADATVRDGKRVAQAAPLAGEPPARRQRRDQQREAREREREADRADAEAALESAAEAVFKALAGAAASSRTEGAESSVIDVAALAAALKRFRVPEDVCKPEDVEDLLVFAAERAGLPPDCPLSRPAFGRFFPTLKLKVKRDGRVW
eukprot:gnl/TRDRNA2_/TRDRNA2_40182_c0_seq1.p1 gnl/TRDRNA2_/TRDRNA2_40182_c0~~gnl/TRDRNA2_/TRDRNA2_40182_c0_seq1.p1  ORF type:complete len:200 (+),score=52.12 gnl/TRDRNA2_/TRDRNA2_40182_c0_seq1:51-650(+)